MSQINLDSDNRLSSERAFRLDGCGTKQANERLLTQYGSMGSVERHHETTVLKIRISLLALSMRLASEVSTDI